MNEYDAIRAAFAHNRKDAELLLHERPPRGVGVLVEGRERLRELPRSHVGGALRGGGLRCWIHGVQRIRRR